MTAIIVLLKSAKVIPRANCFKHLLLNNLSINLFDICHTGSQDYTYWWCWRTISEDSYWLPHLCWLLSGTPSIMRRCHITFEWTWCQPHHHLHSHFSHAKAKQRSDNLPWHNDTIIMIVIRDSSIDTCYMWSIWW